MSPRYKSIVNVLFRATDALVASGAWLAAYYARLLSPRFGQKDLPVFSTYASLAPLILLLWAGVFSFLGVYQSGRMRGRKGEVFLIWRAHATALLIFAALAFLINEYRYSRLVMLYFAVFGAFALAVFRVSLRTVLRALRRRGYDVRRVVIVGGGEAVRKLVERFSWYPELGMGVAGLVTRDGAAPSWGGASVPILGRFSDIVRVVESKQPNEVFIALATHEQSELDGLLGRLRDATVSVLVIPDVQGHVALGCHVEHIEGMAVIRLNEAPMESWQSLAKRCIDATLSAIGIVVLSPLLLLIVAGVKLTSPGPVLYAQERVGLDGQTFRMYKFRSMRADAEAESGAGWTTKEDRRRTAFGTFLRKTSLDELPQLWNVLVGHMSLVGPRPERPVFVQQFRQQIPDYMFRHKVKAGITGWAQVNGWRGDTSLTERTACDLYYIRNWSLDLDLKILLLTLWKGFVNKNAY
jgi:Undecaprenyl-phosphate glucose phosphotransferase